MGLTIIRSNISFVNYSYKYLVIVHSGSDLICGAVTVRCPICSDGISFPNKFIFNILIQTIDELECLQREYMPSWGVYELGGEKHKGKYDIYFEKDGRKYIVEMDGGLGHGNKSFTGCEREIEKSSIIDYIKDQLAFQQGIIVFRIDANYENEDRFEYIRRHIMESPLVNIVNLSNVDFNIANINSQRSELLMSCEMWNQGHTVGEILEEIHPIK